MATRRKRSNELDAADRNAMPDSAYAFPRLRKEPLNDASHVRNAIARFDQVRDASDTERQEAFRRIRRAAARYDVEMTADRWQDLGRPTAPTRSAEQAGSRDQLYAEAKRRNIRGRSTMTKDQLAKALNR
ncbi:DUF6582 domain-containing protein [Dactylosporangium sp. NPDC005572]|uniref:DUF6582 domain-containing protein n=1 Tax=Dactylosporangium sp. NPDC005572 TaxID=3156889 RepID=UPI0033BF9FA1